jgi:hypothetical protein
VKARRSVLRARRAGLGWLALVLLLCTTLLAHAAPLGELVIVLEPTNASPLSRQAFSRIKDELSADRFRVVLAAPSAESAAAAVIESSARNLDRGAIIALFGNPETGETELCIIRRAGRRTAVRRAVVIEDPDRVPQLLSLRALELLRATALELSIDPDQGSKQETGSQQPDRPLAVPAPPAVPEQPAAFTLDLGVAGLQSVNGPPPAFAPVARLALGLTSCFQTRLSVLGLGTRPRVATANGSATVAQDLALLELTAVLRATQSVRPQASLGSGLLSVKAAGSGKPPYEGREAHQWSAAVDAGLGVAFALRSRAAVVAELHALLAWPHPAVRLLDVRTATIAYPAFIFTLALQVAP